MTTLALGVAGAAAGFAIGGPFGASIGWSLGAYLGATLDPQKIEGPRLSDLKLQGSAYGVMEPVIYGTVRLAGNVVAQPPELTEHSHTSGSGGKGGSTTKTTTYSYSVAYLDVLISDCPLTAMLKIWADGRQIFPVEDDSLPVTFYDGSEDQLPDPAEEAATGVGLTPAYRGTGRAVFNEWDLSEFYNRIPQLEFLVTTTSAADVPIYHVATIAKDPEWTDGTMVTEWGTTWDDTPILADPTATIDADALFVATEYAFGTQVAWYPYVGRFIQDDDTVINVYLSRSSASYPTASSDTLPSITDGTIHFDSESNSVVGTNLATLWSIPDGIYVTGVVLSANGRMLFVFTSPTDDGTADHWYKIVNNLQVADGNVIGSPALASLPPELTFPVLPGSKPVSGSIGNTSTSAGIGPVSYAISQCENDGLHFWTYFGNSGGLWLSEMQDNGDIQAINFYQFVPGEQVGACRPSMQITEDGYCGLIFRGLTSLYSRLGPRGNLTLAEVVADLCERDGLTAYDVSQLTDIVDGYIVSHQMAGRAAIEALMPVYFFDAVESDGVVRFVKRGAASAATIADDDLAAHEDGQGLPALLSFTRAQEVDLPAMMSIVYFNKAADYQTGTQTSQRMCTESELTSTVQTTVVLDDDHARWIVDAWLYNAWIERDAYKFSTTRKWAHLEPTDVVTVQGITLRIAKKTESESGVIAWEGVPSHQGVWSQFGVGGPSDGFVPTTVPGSQLTDLVLLDIPLLTHWTAQSSWRPAMAGHDRTSWRGAALMKSTDGINYEELITSGEPDIIGVASDVLPDFGGGNVVDQCSSVTIVIGNGATLESSTLDGMINGANEAVLGRELIQFRDATLTDVNTYVLTGLLRGRRGTEWAMDSHEAGESFVLLPTAIEMPSSSAEFGMPRKYKAVTAGSAVSTAVVHDFTTRGISVTPLSPMHAYAGIDSSGDWTFNWIRRARINAAFLNFVDVPLDETTESYEIKFYADGTYATVLASFNCSTPTYTLTSAQQTTLYGSPQTDEPPWTVAQIGSYGPGYDSLGNEPATAVPPPPTGMQNSISYTVPWDYSTTYLHTEGFGPDTTLVISFTVPGGAPTGQTARVSAAEFGGGPVPRCSTISSAPGDFTSPILTANDDPSPIFFLHVGTEVAAGQTYYFNCRNVTSVGVPTTAVNAEMSFQLTRTT